MKFLKHIFSNSEELSSKRIFGGICLIAVIVFGYIQMNKDIFDQLIYVGASLLGLETINQITKR